MYTPPYTPKGGLSHGQLLLIGVCAPISILLYLLLLRDWYIQYNQFLFRKERDNFFKEQDTA